MLKQTLKKGISTPIAIGIILILVILVGSFTWWQYSETRKGEAEFSEIEIPEKEKEEPQQEEIAPEELTDLEKCLAMPGLYGRVDCLRKIDISEKDLKVCEKMETRLKKDRCYKDIAEAKQDQNLCGKIQRLEEKNHCYTKVALAKQDPVLCKKIQYLPMEVYCYRLIAKVKQDLAICDEIEDQFIKENCYISIAVAKQNLTICEGIQDQTSKNWCYEKSQENSITAAMSEKIVYKEPFTFSVIIKNNNPKSIHNLSVELDTHDHFETTETLKKEVSILNSGKSYTFSWKLIPNRYESLKIDIIFISDVGSENEIVYIPVLEIYPTEQTPEEVANRFLGCYTGEVEDCIPFEKNPDVTEEFKQKIAEIREAGTMIDPIIYAQDIPEKFISGKAVITDNTASLITTTESWENYGLRIDFLLVDNQWKINNTRDARTVIY